MTTYYNCENKQKGLITISSFVFTQIAESCVKSLMENELKDKITMKDGRKKCKIETLINKNKVCVNVQYVATKNADPIKASTMIQEEVYRALCQATEISDIRVNVSLLGVLA